MRSTYFKNLLLFVSCLTLMSSMNVLAFAKTPAPAKKWGEPLTLTEPKSLTEQLAGFDPSKPAPVLVKGKVEKVCQAKGCWMNIKDGEKSVRVTFKNYGFFVDKKLFGKTVLAQGVFDQKEISVKDQKHYLKDEGRPQSEIDKIKEPKVEISFVATGVELASDSQ